MSITQIWIAATAICLVPIYLLYRGNPRAVPLGFFTVMGPLAFIFGLLGLGGTVSGSEWQALHRLWIEATVTMAVLAIFSFGWLNRSTKKTATWVVRGWLVWAFVVIVFAKASSFVGNVKRAAQNEAELKEMADPNSIYSKTKAAYDRPQPPPVPLIQQAINSVNTDLEALIFRPARFVYFGDEKKPETVSIWAIFDRDSADVFGHMASPTGDYFRRFNKSVSDRGLTGPVGVGITTEALISAAGGDSSYFGENGSRVAPQYPHDYDVHTRVADLSPPSRNIPD